MQMVPSDKAAFEPLPLNGHYRLIVVLGNPIDRL